MTANRSLEFARLASAALSSSYRRLWQSQAAYYAGQHIGNSEPRPELVEGPLPGPASKPTPEWRAANEGAWARLFDALGVAYEYKGRFFFPARATWLEVKEAAPTEREIAAARALVTGGARVYMVSGWPRRKEFGVWVFAREGEAMAVRSDYCDLALCNLLEVSFERLYGAF